MEIGMTVFLCSQYKLIHSALCTKLRRCFVYGTLPVREVIELLALIVAIAQLIIDVIENQRNKDK